MSNEIIFVVEEAPEGGYNARALGESIFTQADDFNTLKDMIREAVLCHFDLGNTPKLIRIHFVKEELITV